MVFSGVLASIFLSGSAAGSVPVYRTVVSITFDDGRISQWTARDLLKNHGMNATFYLNSGTVDTSGFLSWAQVGSLAADGNEIGGHTIDHPDLTTLSPAGATHQVCDDRARLLVGLAPGASVVSFAYPFGSSDDSATGVDSLEAIVAGCGYTSARITQGILGSAPWCVTAGCPFAETIPPWDPYGVRATGSVTTSTTLDQLESFVTNAEQNGGGWVPFVFHDIGTADTYSISEANFSAFLDWLAARESKGTIVRTVGEVMSGTVTPPPGPNLLQNPSFENVTGGLPDCWEKTHWGSNDGDWTVPGDIQRTGSVAVRGEITSSGTGDRQFIVDRSSECAAPAEPGHSYRLTGWYQGALSPFFTVYWLDDAGDWTSNPIVSPQFPVSAGNWHEAAWTTPVAPAGTTGVSFGFAIPGDTAGDVTIDDLSLGDVAGTPPDVQIISPAGGGYISGQTATLAASAGADTQSVQFFVDDQPVGTVTSSPFTLSWDSTTVAEGSHTLTVVATASDQSQSSDTSTFSVDNTAPQSSISCGGGACGSGIYPAAVSATLTASDTGGSGVGTIRYTLDGSDPGESSPAYGGTPLTIPETTTVRWRAYDVAGNAESVHSQLIRINAAPTVQLTAPADDSYLSAQSVTLSADASDDVGVDNVQFLVDGSAIGLPVSSSPYSRSWDTSAYADGPHTVTAIATDTYGLQSSDSRSVTLDTVPPDVSLDTKPANPSKSAAASFAFSVVDDNSTTTLCSLDGAGDASCDNPQAYAGLTDGSHTFSVEATDLAGNQGEASWTWTVDTIPPSGLLTAPTADSFLRGTVTLESNSSDTGSGVASVSFERSRAGESTWTTISTEPDAPYSASWVTSPADDGSWNLRVVTTDKAGNTRTSPSVSITVDNTAPDVSLTAPIADSFLRGTITLESNSSDTGSGVASVSFERSPAGENTWTTISTEPGAPYSASWVTSPADDGSWNLRVVTTDKAGNTRISPSVSITVDNTAPDVSLDTKPANPSNSAAASFAFSVVDDNSTTTLCSLDGAGDASCDNPQAYAGLTDGSHTFSVEATDLAGNQGEASWTWTVDTIPPSGLLTAPTADSFLRGTVTLESNSSDTGSGVASVSFQRSPTGESTWTTLGSDTTSPYSADWDTTAATDGSYDLRAVTSDLAGNRFVSPMVSVTVDNTPPTGSLTRPDSNVFVKRYVEVSSDSVDPTSGVASVAFQIAPTSYGPWQTAATVTSAPWSATLRFPKMAQGRYYVRAVTADRAGNTFVSPARRVGIDNTAPTSSIACNGKPGCRAVYSRRAYVTIRAYDRSSGVRAIRYTTNRKMPTASSRLYRGRFKVKRSTIVRWRVWDRAGNVSRAKARAIRVSVP